MTQMQREVTNTNGVMKGVMLTFPTQQRRFEREGNALLFNDFIDKWLSGKLARGLAISTADKYKSLIKLHIKPWLGDKEVGSITLDDVQDLLDEKALTMASSTIREIKSAILFPAFKVAERKSLISVNPAQFAEVPKVKQKPARPFTQEEIKKIIPIASQHCFYIGLMLMLFGGLRRGEMLALTWNCVDFNNKELIIDKSYSATMSSGMVLKDTKNESSNRVVPIPDTLLELLRTYKDNAGNDKYVCRQKKADKMVEGKHFNTVLATWCSKAGIEGISTHSCRHTYATLMYEQGVDLLTIASNMGHTTTRMLETKYIHRRTNALQQASARILDNAFKGFGI